ncbi:hypothetical protein A2264_03735 [candidate division WWE3 bacterium RIFOXYA2_FULL_46_9]|uniref:Uncharacterized protein n=1 Tax=candidate division WWE3 bacterium RIFOXYA2_FULL_46_9 TaxID=1802636 RepID=A0A1F4W1N7_UNCKA|nr:MAG: hypothetical protein A2264_03735 [candidate division WWE3 bacterium RIFOXYA2_FULL_46_9]OGC65010.1 MAG: hypothetical protein A2326_03155 [candidate division WWE3 bacterium RIFOXYB2_FULL_41_6]HLD51562.1 hypothetical protein [Patescibacteria group bacterium]
MKSLIFASIASIIGLLLWLSADFRSFNKDGYISKEVLDSSIPINVTIDIEYLTRFKPAYD